MVAESVAGESVVGSENNDAQSTIGPIETGPPKVDAVEVDAEKAAITGVFGVLYRVSREKGSIPRWFVALWLLLDWLQLFLLIVNPQYGFDINARNQAWKIFSFIQLNAFMSARGFAFYLACLYLMVAGLLMSIVLCVLVGRAFQANQFQNQTWPIVVLRWWSDIFLKMLGVMSMTLLLMPLDCQYFDRPSGVRYHDEEFPDVYCWSPLNLIHIVFSSVSLVVFVILAAAFTMAEVELNLVTTNPLAQAHTGVEVQAFVIRVMMTCFSVFIVNVKWLSVLQLVLTLVMFNFYLTWVPYYHAWVNKFRTASYATIVYSSILLVFIAFTPGCSHCTPSERHEYRQRVTWALWAGLLPAALFGALAAHLRLRHFHGAVLKRFRTATSQTRQREIYEFTDAREVEILVRCCRVFVNVDLELDPAAVALAEQVVKVGLSQLSRQPYMIILQSSFLIEVRGSYQSGYAQLQSAKKLKLSLTERFAIFVREQMHTQQAGGGQNGQVTDLASFVDFKRKHKQVVRVHREVLMLMRTFWTKLLQKTVHFDQLASIVKQIDVAVRDADRVYRTVMARHGSNVRIIRLYAKFLEHVKRDPWAANKWFMEAQRLEQADEDAKNSSVLGEMEIADPTLKAALMAAAESRSSDPNEATGVIIMSAQSVLQLSNLAATELLGYGRNELRGRNINVLLPPPLAQVHHNYVRKYLETGEETILNKHRELVMMHRDCYIIPVDICVTKVSGLGEDSVFMCVFKVLPSSPNVCKLWVMPSGMVVSVDNAFADILGHRAQDVAGQPITNLLYHDKEVAELMAVARRDGEVGLMAMRAAKQGQSQPQQEEGCMRPVDILKSAVRSASVDFVVPYTPGVVRSDSHLGQEEEGGENAGARVVKKHGFGGPWSLTSVLAYHKYADKVRFNATVHNGGIGNFMFLLVELEFTGHSNVTKKSSQQLSLSPAPPTPKHHATSSSVQALPHMLVCDPQGRILHCTKSLAGTLGTTMDVLVGGGQPFALHALLQEPFSHMHATLTAPEGPLSSPPPPHSCRSGLSVMLLRQVPLQPPQPTPFRVHIQHRLLTGPDEAESTLHVAVLEEVTFAEALDERRLKIRLSAEGMVTYVGASPQSLFGFNPKILAGHTLDDFIDVFKEAGQAGLGDNNLPGSSELLLLMAMRSHQHPGESWRVGVSSPVSPEVRMRNLPATERALMTVVSQRSTPAVMMVTCRYETVPTRPGTGNIYSGKSVEIEVELWRSDMLTSLLEVDTDGFVRAQRAPISTYLQGLALGMPSNALVGRHLGRLLPPLADRPIEDLYKAGAFVVAKKERQNRDAPKRKRSSMKRALTEGDARARMTGPLQQMKVLHATDGEALFLTVQAVQKPNGWWLILRPMWPSCGHAGLLMKLMTTMSANSAKQAGPWWLTAGCVGSHGGWSDDSDESSSEATPAEDATGQYGPARTSPARPMRSSSFAAQNQGDRVSPQAPAAPKPKVGVMTRPQPAVTMGGPAENYGSHRSGSMISAGFARDITTLLGAMESTGGVSVVSLRSVAQSADSDLAAVSSLRRPSAVRFGGIGASPADAAAALGVVAGKEEVTQVQVVQGRNSFRNEAAASLEPLQEDASYFGTIGRPSPQTQATTRAGIQLTKPSSGQWSASRRAIDEAAASVQGSAREMSQTPNDNSNLSNSNLDDAEAATEAATALTDPTEVADFRAGKRFKKLHRILNGRDMQENMHRFKLHSQLLSVAIVVVHAAIFSIVFMMLEQDRVVLNEISDMGKTM